MMSKKETKNAKKKKKLNLLWIIFIASVVENILKQYLTNVA